MGMTEKLCFVQFIHPGGEHAPDEPGLKHWNRDAHRRKFLKGDGRWIDAAGKTQTGELVFWGEWEPPSRIVAAFAPRVPDGPAYLHEPILDVPSDGRWRQNTDPFVFGDTFHYTGCLQHTKRGDTQLRHLKRGSALLMGSCRERSRFVIDTVFVVDHWIDHTALDYREVLDGAVSEVYWDATIEPWYLGDVPEKRSHRLYFGATPEDPIEGMFSFFPCSTLARHANGFARPEIRLRSVITSQMTQGRRLNPQARVEDAAALWRQVVDQVRTQGLELGTFAALPPRVATGAPTPAGEGRRGC